jgi:excisionase family DNA binding protein
MHLVMAKEASRILNVSLPRLYELARLRVIPSVRLGPRQIRFDEEALAQWVKHGGANQITGASEPTKARDAV